MSRRWKKAVSAAASAVLTRPLAGEQSGYIAGKRALAARAERSPPCCRKPIDGEYRADKGLGVLDELTQVLGQRADRGSYPGEGGTVHCRVPEDEPGEPGRGDQAGEQKV